MPDVTQQVQGRRVRRVAITIPASGGGKRLIDLIRTAWNAIDPRIAAAEVVWIIGGKVHIAAADYTAGDSAASQPLTITAGAEYSEAASGFLRDTFVASKTASTIDVCVSVILSGPYPDSGV